MYGPFLLVYMAHELPVFNRYALINDFCETFRASGIVLRTACLFTHTYVWTTSFATTENSQTNPKLGVEPDVMYHSNVFFMNFCVFVSCYD